MAIHLVYETHAITEDNERGIATGWRPGRLSARGREVAAQLGDRRRGSGIDTVFVPDLWRAVHTAGIAFAGSRIPVVRDARLRECDYGELTGRPVAALAGRRARHLDEPCPGGQNYRQVVAGVRAFLDELATAEWDGRRVLLIGHAATRWALDHLLAGAELAAVVDAPFDWRPGWTYSLPVHGA
jgi:broad specificity phosphatase PhoE